MPRGGRRNGRAATAYENRSDLTAAPKPLPVSTSAGQEYGTATRQQQSQEAVPMANAPLSTSPAPAGGGGPHPPAPAGPSPGSLTPLDAPTQRPNEPLTAGAPFGPGAGPMAGNTTVDQLRALYMADPNEDIRQLLEAYDQGVYS